MILDATLVFDNGEKKNVTDPMILIRRVKNTKLVINKISFHHEEEFHIIFNNTEHYKSDIIKVDLNTDSEWENSEFVTDIENKIINGECSITYLYKFRNPKNI